MIPRSIKQQYPIDPITVEILLAVAAAARSEGADYMLVGATARDILLKHVFGIAPERATYDVDFAVAVEDWQQFDALKRTLLATGRFSAGKAEQRLYYKGEKGDVDYQIDLVPFGGVTRGTNEVAWPPDMAIVMNVAGYDEAIAAAEYVEFSPGVVGKVVSLAGLATLKLVAWSDRGRENPRDAIDLFHLMNSYTDAGNVDRIYDVEGIIEAVEYDPVLAGVVLLGKDMARLVSTETLGLLRQIIDRDFDRMVLAMIRSKRTLDDVRQQVEKQLRLLRESLS